MGYTSRGRSMVEVIIAVTFVGFLTGFVIVLCIGNYFRAKRAMERQRQRRLARLASGGGNGVVGLGVGHPGPDSPRSHQSSATSGGSARSGDEKQRLINKQHPADFPRRRQGEENNDLLGLSENSRQTVNLMSV